MRLFSDLRGSGVNSITALFEIGSGSVGAVLFQRTPGQRADFNVMFSKRYEMPLQENIDFKRFSKSMLDALTLACTELMGSPAVKKNGRPHSIHVVFGAPWYLSRSKINALTEPKPFAVTAPMLASINKTAADEFLASADVTTGEQIEHAPKLIEHMPVQILLNGYSSSSPVGKKVQSLSVAMYESVVSKAVFQSVFDIVNRTTGHTPSFHSASLVYYKTLGALFPEPDNYLVATVEQEVTEVSLIEGDVIKETVSTPLGTNHLLRALTTSRKTVPEEALSLYMLATSMQAHSNEEKTLAQHLEKARVKALTNFAQTCNALAGAKPLPSTLYLLSAPQFAQWFASVFSDSSCAQYTSLGDPFQVISVTREHLSSAAGAQTLQFPDAQLALESLYVSKYGEV